MTAALASTTWAIANNVPLATTSRSRSRVAALRAQAPFKSDAQYDYFRKIRQISVTLAKPLGAVLEECPPAGVRVEELQDGGSAAETGLLKKGDRIRSVQGVDVSQADFDEVMELLVGAPAEVELGVGRVVVTRRPRIAPTLTVDGSPVEVESGVIMRTAITANGFELYRGLMAKAQQCGGGGQCNLCWVDVVDGADKLSPKTDAERKRGKKKPESFRMACQALINGPVSVRIPDK